MTQSPDNKPPLRRLAQNEPPSFAPRSELPGRITDVRRYKLITPLFGGGAENHISDPITTVRVTEIRGQLRFWWRACRAGQYGSIEKMKAAEDSIWGAANLTSSSTETNNNTNQQHIQMTTKVIDTGTQDVSFIIEKNNATNKYKSRINPITGMPPYAAFPLQPTQDDLKKDPPPTPPSVRTNVCFELTLSYPEAHKTDIDAALWAWETFGGIGARTRRGFGALLPCNEQNRPAQSLPANSHKATVCDWLQTQLLQHVSEGKPPAGVPALSQKLQFHITHASTKPAEAWNHLISKLSAFRQLPFGRDKRSYWPEAEAIRTLTNKRDSKYRPRNHPAKFPRAVFGLPIVFHFKDRNDPIDTTLQGADEKHQRLASPLILRPLMCRDNQSVGLAMLLEGRQLPPEGLVLQEKNEGRRTPRSFSVQANLTEADLRKIPDLRLHNETNILQAFMQFLGGK